MTPKSITQENSLFLPTMIQLERRVYKKFINEPYANKDKNFYNKKVVTDIMVNNSTHLVALFKDYLIENDISEFIQNYYELGESLYKLIELCEYYNSCCVIYPNYSLLLESIYISKNIQRKQKLIDFIQYEEDERKKKENQHQPHEKEDIIFDSTVNHSIWDLTTHNSELMKIMGINEKKKKSPDRKNYISNSVEKLIKIIDNAEKISTLHNKMKLNLNFIYNSRNKNEHKKPKCDSNRLFNRQKLKSNLNLYFKINSLALSKKKKSATINTSSNLRTNCTSARFSGIINSTKKKPSTTPLKTDPQKQVKKQNTYSSILKSQKTQRIPKNQKSQRNKSLKIDDTKLNLKRLTFTSLNTISTEVSHHHVKKKSPNPGCCVTNVTHVKNNLSQASKKDLILSEYRSRNTKITSMFSSKKVINTVIVKGIFKQSQKQNKRSESGSYSERIRKKYTHLIRGLK